MFHLIIADDEDDIRNGLTNLIPWSEWGFVVDGCFQNGEEVVRYLSEHTPDAVLLDIIMKGKSGLDVAQWIYQHQHSTQVVLLSGYAEFKYAKQAIRYGVRNYLSKPTDVNELKQAFSLLHAELTLRQERLSTQDNMLKLLLSTKDAVQEMMSQYIEKAVEKDVNELPIIYQTAVQKSYIHKVDKVPNNIALTKKNEDIIQLIEWMHEDNCDFHQSLSDWANRLSLHPAYLSRLFKVHAGCTFVKYYSSIKMERAKKLLVTTQMTVSKIADQLGYTDIKHFYTLFKDTYGITPSQFRHVHEG